MSKVLKKMKLNELQKENFGSKEMQKISGGSCGCVSICIDSQGINECFMDGYMTAWVTCGCN